MYLKRSEGGSDTETHIRSVKLPGPMNVFSIVQSQVVVPAAVEGQRRTVKGFKVIDSRTWLVYFHWRRVNGEFLYLAWPLAHLLGTFLM